MAGFVHILPKYGHFVHIFWVKTTQHF